LQGLKDPEVLAAEYLDNVEEALAGARDILADEMMETAEARGRHFPAIKAQEASSLQLIMGPPKMALLKE